MGRSRGGVKVPGVKLRPADSKPTQSRKNVIESDDDELVAEMPLQGGRDIFKGVVLCATGIRDKHAVFELVKRMGGTHSTDFTDSTTHLISQAPGSEKYRCAIERAIPVLTSSWIYDAHKRWLAGETFSVKSTEAGHRLLPFRGMKLCLTGVETAELRQRILELTERLGGTFLKSLDKSCTHLLCAVPTSVKITWAIQNNSEREKLRLQSYSSEVSPSIAIVWIEWFWDCAHVGGFLLMDNYLLSNPRPVPMSTTIMDPTPKVPKPLPYTSNSSTTTGSRTVLPTSVPLASLDGRAFGDSVVPAKRLKDAALKEWQTIVKPRASKAVNGEVHPFGSIGSALAEQGVEHGNTSSPMKKAWDTTTANQSIEHPGWARRSPMEKGSKPDIAGVGRKKISAIPLQSEKEDENHNQSLKQSVNARATTNESKPSKVSQVRKANKLADKVPAAAKAPAPSISVINKLSRQSAFESDGSRLSVDTPTTEMSMQLPRPRVFAGVSFTAIGDTSCDEVFSALGAAGGAVVTKRSPDYYVVRLVGGHEHMMKYSAAEHHKFRTECWLEQCLFENRICSVDENITYAPIKPQTASIDPKPLIAFSGLDASERTWVQRLLRLLAIDISPHFSAKCTHLLCPSREGPKFQKAVEWDIPVVDFDWIKGLATSDSKANQSGNAKGDHVVDPTAMSPAATLDSLRVENSMRRLNLEADGQRQDSDSPLPPNLHPGSESGTSASFPSPRALLGKKRESGGSDTSKGSAGSNQSSDGKSGHINTTALTEELSSTETLTGPENQVQTRTPIRKLPTQRIASSASPSPLKLHPTMSPNPIEQKIRKQASNASPASTGGIAAATTTTTKTPAAIPSTVTASMLAFESASAKALSRNIGAILGSKRPIEDDQDADNNSVSSANEGPRKRPRRPQAKGKGLTPRKLGLMTSIPSFGNENQNQNREDSSTREGSNAPQLLLEPNTAPKGIGVLYDDPIAREEHRRLLHLLNGGEASPPPSTATTTASGRSRSGRKSKGNMNLGQ